MRRITVIASAILATAALAACGDSPSKNNKANNTTANNTTANNTTVNNTTPNNVQNSTTNVCDGKTCDAPAANCTGQIAVTYSGAGTCEAETGSCSYDAVESRVDCTTTGQVCLAGACVTDVDLCEGVMCDAPPVAPTCEAGTAVTIIAGVCEAATGMCDYSNSEVRVDCTANGQVCAAGACVDPTPTPNPGELTITEVMPNPVAVGDAVGEWFEVYNNTTRDLDLNGLTIIDDGTDSFPIPASTPLLAAGAYLVFGINADMGTNGGLAVDIPYTGINLANRADELVIIDANLVEIDRVAWDDTAGWTIPAGATLNFGGQFDVVSDDNSDPQFWCAALTSYGAGDLGTPGAANDTCPSPVTVTLYQLSNDADANYPGVNTPVVVAGVAITAIDAAKGYVWLQETAGGPYSGIYVDAGGVDVTALAVGDVVDIEGAYDEWNGALARITATLITDTGNDMVAVPQVVESSVLADAATAEEWENVLLQINEAGVTDMDAGASFKEALIDSNIIVDDLLYGGFFDNASECQLYATIVGPLNFSFGAFKIEPRNAADIGAPITAISSTSVAQANFAFTPAAICVTAGATVTWTNADLTGHTVTSRLPSQTTANIPAAPLFDEVLAGAGTATVMFPNAGSFHYRCRPHANMTGVVVVPDP